MFCLPFLHALSSDRVSVVFALQLWLVGTTLLLCSFPTSSRMGCWRRVGPGGSEVEACRAEYQSFVQEHRQLERSSTSSHPDVGDVLSFCSGQAGFRTRRHLYEVCIVTSQVCGFNPLVLSQPSMWLCISGVPVDDACDPWVFSKV